MRQIFLNRPDHRLPAVLATLLAVLLLCLTARPALAEDQVLFTSSYKGEFSGWNIKMTRTLTRKNDNRYEFSSVASNLFATVRETSQFDFKSKVVLPSEYRFYRNVFGKKATETLTFDWPAKAVHYEHSAKSYKNKTMPLDQPILDPSLYQLFVQRDAYLGEKNPVAYFVKRDRFRTYEFEFAGETKITLAKVERPALLFKKKSDDESETTIWLIPSLDYQIGKIIHKDEDDERYEVEMTGYRSDSKALQQFYRESATK